MIIVKLYRTQGGLTAWSVYREPCELAYAQCACVLSARKMADPMYGRQREGALDLRNSWVLEKTLQIFWPSLPTEYVTPFSGRTEAPEVRCDLTDNLLFVWRAAQQAPTQYYVVYSVWSMWRETHRHGNSRNIPLRTCTLLRIMHHAI